MPRLKLVRSFREASTRKRLWLGGSAVAIFLLSLIGTNLCLPADKKVTLKMLGSDFLPFYCAGRFVRLGQLDQLYFLPAIDKLEHQIGGAAGITFGKSFGPWWNPPFAAWPFVPLSKLTYRQALGVWEATCLASIAIAVTLLVRMLTSGTGFQPVSWIGEDRKTRVANPCHERSLATWGLVPLLMVCSMPFLQAISHGQNTFVSLMLLTSTIAFWRADRGFVAGLVGGLLFFKPQLAAVLAVAAVVDLGWPALLGFAVTGTALLLVTVLTLPGSLTDFLIRMPQNVHWIQVENTYLWERHATLKAFWRLLLQGRDAGEMVFAGKLLTILTAGALGASLVAVVVRNKLRRDNSPAARDRLIAATIAAMPLLMPFYFDYDLLLLAVPAVLYARDRLQRPAEPGDGWLTAAWSLLFVWLFVNPGIAGHTRVNLTVVWTTCVAAMLIRRASRRIAVETVSVGSELIRPALPMAA